MAKASRAFVCQACGAVSPRWAGQCAVCGEWNSIAEEAAASLSGPTPLIAIRGGKGRPARFETLQAATIDAPRLPTGIAEFDRVTGGGLVPGSAVLVGGDPGIGKSTLLLQGAAALALTGAPCRLPLGRGSHRSSSHARRAARAEAGAGSAGHRDQSRQHHR